MTFSLGSRYPMNRPNAANTREHTQARTPHATRSANGRSAPVDRPIANTTRMDTRPSVIATTILIAMYATGLSGVIRSCLLQPAARSIETIAPVLVVAIIAPYTAIDTMIHAVTLPEPALSLR